MFKYCFPKAQMCDVELLLNKLDSIDWQNFKVADLLKKQLQRGKQNPKKKPVPKISGVHQVLVPNLFIILNSSKMKPKE